MTGILNRVGMLISTTGTGSVTADTLISNRFNTPAEAGAVDGESYYWILEQGTDYEIFEGAWTLSGTVVSRDTVIESKISGVHGTTKLTLGGSATLRSVAPAEAFQSGWTLIDSVTVSSPVANVTFSAIPQNFSEIWVQAIGASHNSGSNQTLNLTISDNGSSFSSGTAANFASRAASVAMDVIWKIVGYSLDISHVQVVSQESVSANDIESAETISPYIAKHTGGVEAVKITPAGGSLDAGTFKLFGR